ncbi:MAG: FMN-binding protein [Candidatus Eisenbacteria bacterium]
MSLHCLVRCAALVAVLAVAAPSSAAVYTTAEATMANAYPGARFEKRTLALSAAEQQSLSRLAQVRCNSRLITVHLAWHGDSLLAAGFIDQRTVRTMPGVFLVVVARDTTVARIEVLAFHEPSDYRPPARWLGLFARKRLEADLWPARSIRALSGASLSARAVTESARLALAAYAHVLAPTLARRVSRFQ